MRGKIAAAIFGVGLLLPNAAQAQCRPSFNCYNVNRPDEVLICNDCSLAALDVRMEELYGELLGNLYGRRLARLKSDQSEWWRSRTRCRHNYQCIRDSYRSRIQELRNDY
jgi:uncharacterized protein